MASPESNRFCVSDLIAAPTIALNLASRDRDSVLGELAGLIPELRDNPPKRATLLTALREREALHSTGIGDGVALPHARTALTGLVSQPVIVFGRHSKGISYGAIDGKPAQLFFLLVTTSVTQHLQLLARLSRLLRSPALRQKLMVALSPEQILQILKEAERSMAGSGPQA
jgi:mannitol/fructose-specific phosphotransferase system IIA component (Ntr-type)